MKRRVVFTRPAYTRPEVTRRVVGDRVQGSNEGERSPSIEGSLPHVFPQGSLEAKKEAQVDNVLDLASKLTKAQQQELLDRLALNSQLTKQAAANRDLDMWAEAVGIALGETIGDGDGGNYGVMLIKRILGSTICWRPVETFMERSKLQGLQVVERQSIYLLLARLLVEHASYRAKKSGAPMSAKLVGSCTSDLTGVFEQSFPGYLAAGLAPMIAKQMHRGHADR